MWAFCLFCFNASRNQCQSFSPQDHQPMRCLWKRWRHQHCCVTKKVSPSFLTYGLESFHSLFITFAPKSLAFFVRGNACPVIQYIMILDMSALPDTWHFFLSTYLDAVAISLATPSVAAHVWPPYVRVHVPACVCSSISCFWFSYLLQPTVSNEAR